MLAVETKILFIITLLFPFLNWAQADEDYCNNLAVQTCRPGIVDDGTGSSRNNQTRLQKLDELHESMKPVFLEKFKEELRSPENGYFRRTALSAFKMTKLPDCQATNEASQRKCDDQLAEKLAKTADKEVFSSIPGMDLSSLLMGLIQPKFGAHPDSPLTFSEENSPGMKANLRDLNLVKSNPVYKEAIESFQSRVSGRIAKPQLEKHVEKDLFPKVKDLLVRKIEEQVADPKTRSILVEKVKGIRWGGTDCAGDPRDIAGMLKPNGGYQPSSNSFQLCSGTLYSSDSEFNLVRTIAHELSHSIDPCRIAEGPRDFKFSYSQPFDSQQSEKENPFRDVIICLRGKDSVDAKALSTAATGMGMASSYSIYKNSGYGMMNMGGGNLLPPAPPGPALQKSQLPSVRETGGEGDLDFGDQNESIFCHKDQITESFADWMAAEIMPQYMAENRSQLTKDQFKAGYSNAFRVYCTPDRKIRGGEGFDPHPSLVDRINKIISANPKIREQMGCPKEPQPGLKYCRPPASGVTSAIRSAGGSK